MRQVIVKQWFESEGGYGRTPRYSLHPDADACQNFAQDHQSDRLHPDGKAFGAEVDDEVFEELESSGEGIWYSGRVRLDGKEVELGKAKN